MVESRLLSHTWCQVLKGSNMQESVGILFMMHCIRRKHGRSALMNI